VFEYRGSKSRIYREIADQVPEGTRTLVSLFTGSGVFEYNYAHENPSVEVVCYEIDPCIVNFHSHVLSDPISLHKAIVELNASLEPMTKEKYMSLYRGMGHSGLSSAAAFYIASVNCFGGKIGSYGKKAKFRSPDYLVHLKMPSNLSIRVGDAFKVLAANGGELLRRDDLTLYLDPPYVLKNNHYRSIDNHKFDHGALADMLNRLPVNVSWILSYNDVAAVRTLYDIDNKTADVDYFSPHSKHYINNANTSSDEILIVKRGGVSTCS
jgi:site-specific DNA-adenine methylase